MDKMKILCVIPSRIGSTRLPRKPLQLIQGKPLVRCVYDNASKSKVINKVVVATDSEEIAQVIKEAGGAYEMTSPDLQTGSDRVAAVAERYSDMDVIINLQGDEPFVSARMLEQLVKPFLDGENIDMSTLAHPLNMEVVYNDPNNVKVITDLNKNAIYFSRSPIPYFRNKVEGDIPVYHHMGLYAYRRDFLLKYTKFPQTPLEKAESLEQLRAMENGYKIRVCLTERGTLEINTPEELERAQTFKFIE